MNESSTNLTRFVYSPAENWAANVATASRNTCGTCGPLITKVEAIAAGFEKDTDWSLGNSSLLWEQPAGGGGGGGSGYHYQHKLVRAPKTKVLSSVVGVGLRCMNWLSPQPNLVPQSGCLALASHCLGAFYGFQSLQKLKLFLVHVVLRWSTLLYELGRNFKACMTSVFLLSSWMYLLSWLISAIPVRTGRYEDLI